MQRIFLTRIAILPLPVYVVAVLVWRFALTRSWLYSLAVWPLDMLIGGVIYCAVTSFYLHRRRGGQAGR